MQKKNFEQNTETKSTQYFLYLGTVLWHGMTFFILSNIYNYNLDYCLLRNSETNVPTTFQDVQEKTNLFHLKIEVSTAI